MSTDAPVRQPVPGPSRRPRSLLLGAAIVLAAAAVVVLLVLLLRDPGEAAPKGSAIPSEQELATLRSEAVTATRTLFERIDQAYATADPKVLDGIYVPGTDLESLQKETVTALANKHEVISRKVLEVEVIIIDVNRTTARTEIRRTATGAETRDSRTGTLKRRETAGRFQDLEVTLARVGGRWLVSDIVPKAS